MSELDRVNKVLRAQHCQLLMVQIDSEGSFVIHFDAEASGCGYLCMTKDGEVHYILPD